MQQFEENQNSSNSFDAEYLFKSNRERTRKNTVYIFENYFFLQPHDHLKLPIVLYQFQLKH